MTDQAPQLPADQKNRIWLFAFGLIGQLGFMIALPIAAFAYGGRMLDERYQTTPLFLLGGVVLASVVTAVWIALRTRSLRNEYMKLFDSVPTDSKRL